MKTFKVVTTTLFLRSGRHGIRGERQSGYI